MRLKPNTFTSTPASFSASSGTQTRNRVVKVTAMLEPKNPAATPRNEFVAPLALKHGGGDDFRLYDTDRGHLVSLEVGGPEASNNLVPMWGTFNRCGAWKKMEAELAQWVHLQNAEAQLTIDVAYALDATVDDPRIPLRFSVHVTIADGTFRQWLLDHGRPVPVLRPNNQHKAELERLRDEMEQAAWVIEDHLDWSQMPRHRPMPAFPMGERPYAMFDYLEYRELLARYGNADRAKSAMADRIQNGGFDEFKRRRMLEANRALNDGHLVTDDPDNDPVVTELVCRPVGFPGGVLVEDGGSDSAPQVDHIIPESRSGTNSYSNAQIISSAHNNALRAVIADVDQQKLRENLDKRPPGRVSKPPDRLGVTATIKKDHSKVKNARAINKIQQANKTGSQLSLKRK